MKKIAGALASVVKGVHKRPLTSIALEKEELSRMWCCFCINVSQRCSCAEHLLYLLLHHKLSVHLTIRITVLVI